MGPEGGRGRGFGSDTITPTRQVMIPAMKRAPPPMNTGRTFAQANTFPDKIVSRQELAAAATSTGPRTTIIIPRMKISDLNLSRNPWEATSFPRYGGSQGGYLILCYYSLAFKEKPRCLVRGRNLLRQWFKNADLHYETGVVCWDWVPCFLGSGPQTQVGGGHDDNDDYSEYRVEHRWIQS